MTKSGLKSDQSGLGERAGAAADPANAVPFCHSPSRLRMGAGQCISSAGVELGSRIRMLCGIL